MDAKEWAAALTEEQRAELGNCKTSDEAVAWCKANGVSIPDELLDGVAGGVGFIILVQNNQSMGMSMNCMGMRSESMEFSESQAFSAEKSII